MRILNTRVLSLVATATLSACGGGSDTPTPPAAAAASVTIAGTAAKGAALAGATVSVKCAAGNGTGTTAIDGKYSVVVTGATLPCALKVVGSDGTTFHSLVPGTGSSGSFSANLSPLSELVLAKAAAGTPAELFDNFDSTAQAKLTAGALVEAVASLIATFQGVIDLTGVDPIKDTLVVGNSLDQKLDALQVVLTAAQTTLAELTAAMASGATTTDVVRNLLQPAASSCASLRSGKYRVIFGHETAGEDGASFLVNIDATALTATDSINPDTPVGLTPVIGTPCMFTAPGDSGPASETILVSRSGMKVARSLSSTGQVRLRYMIPEQALPLSELAGNWNFLEYGREFPTGGFSAESGTATIDTAGRFTNFVFCTGLDNCALVTGSETFTVNAEGGFDINNDEGARAFAFKAASGQTSMFIVNPVKGTFVVLAKQTTLSLPAVGEVSNFWDFSVNSSGFAETLSDFSTTVRSVDTVAGSYTRQRQSDGRIDGFTLNAPRAGFRYRPAGSSSTNSGATINFSGVLVMPLPGTGVTFYTNVASTENFFGVAIGKP